MPPVKLSSPQTGDFWEIPVLYEDDHVLALDKPGNILTAPDRKDPDRPSLSRLLHEGIRREQPWATARHLSFLANAHRLDYEISGVLSFAKNEPALQRLNNVFGSELPLVNCVTVVRGEPRDEAFEVSANLLPDANRSGLMKVDATGGKRAVTRFEVIERFRGWTLLRCCPLTQRLHQIRVHLRAIKLPVAGDSDYGGRPLMLSGIKTDYRLKPGRKERPLIGNPILHVERITLTHPMNGEPLVIDSEWTKELRIAVKYLRQFASL